jgi:hypothetical protein
MNGTAMQDSICESSFLSQDKMFSFFLVEDIDRLPYALRNDGFIGLAPSDTNSPLKSYLESLTNNSMALGNHFTTNLANGLPVVTFGSYEDTD